MIKVLFVCYGNICRSPMGEFILKELVKKDHLEDQFEIASSGTSDEEVGHPVYYLAKEKLEEHGLSCEGKFARQVEFLDYDKYDYILAMDDYDVGRLKIIFNRDDISDKVYKLLDFTSSPKNIEDPWQNRNFDRAYEEIYAGCVAFLNFVKKKLA